MSAKERVSIARKMLVLCLLAGATFFMLVPEPITGAAPCCETCNFDVAACETECAVTCNGTDNECFYPCYQACDQRNIRCISRCVSCRSTDSGGGGGASFCEFGGPAGSPNSGFEVTISCPNGYSGSCWSHMSYNTICCDNTGFPCYYP